MKIIYTGIESSGKSLLLSRQAEKVLNRNRRWLKIVGIPRTMAFNSPMSKEFIEKIKSTGINYLEYKNLDDIIYTEETDIFMDEVIKYFPAGQVSLTNEQLHFITQGAKSGIHLWGASQDFSQVHKQFRRLVNEVYIIKKIIGNRRPMKTAPPVKTIWGICAKQKVNPQSFTGDNATMDEMQGGFSFFFITKRDVERFDTSYKIPLTSLPIKKVRRQIERCDEDGYEKVRYI